MDERFALDGYVVDELIGFGGSGEVWRAHEVATGETVALKRLRTRGAAATERLRREASLLAIVAGPHVIGVRRLVIDGDEAVLVMDHAPGGSLATVLGVRGRLPAPEVVTVLAPVAAALAAAHVRELIHGDITPANILFTADGRPLLADFGVARAMGTVQNRVEGTVDYLDPAVVAGAAPTAAADVFALGAVGFSSLTGQSLWGSGPAADVLARAARGDRPALADLAPATPEPLVAVIESMLDLEPDDRPAARSVSNAVLRACAAAPVGLVHSPAPTPPPMTHPVPRPAAPDGVPVDSGGPAGRRSVVSGILSWRWRHHAAVFGAVALSLVGAAGLGVGLAHFGHGQAHALAPQPNTSLPSLTPIPNLTPIPTHPSAAATKSASSDGAPAAAVHWLGVVRRLDALRAEAFSTADPTLLAAVYAPGASAYADDLATVRSLASRGLHARGFSATVDRVRVQASSAATERLQVVDHLSGYVLVDGSGDVVGRGAARAARRFTMSLKDVGGTWRVAAVRSN